MEFRLREVENWYQGEVHQFDEGERRHGVGAQVFHDGSMFEGTWHRGKITEGRFITAEGSVYTGKFQNDLYTGEARMSYLTGASYEGYYRNGKRHGLGTQVNGEGKVTLGRWENGELVEEFNEDTFDEEMADYDPESEESKSDSDQLE